MKLVWMKSTDKIMLNKTRTEKSLGTDLGFILGEREAIIGAISLVSIIFVERLFLKNKADAELRTFHNF